MSHDKVQPLAGVSRSQTTGAAAAVFRLSRLSRAETADNALFIAPGRLQVARQRMMADLFGGVMPPPPWPCNDN